MTTLALVGNIVDAEVEAALGLPRGKGGRAWNFRRAGLPHSLAERRRPCSISCSGIGEDFLTARRLVLRFVCSSLIAHVDALRVGVLVVARQRVVVQRGHDVQRDSTKRPD